MTVKELIEALSEFDPNLEVMIPHEDGHDYLEEVFSVDEVLLLTDGDGVWVYEEEKQELDDPENWVKKALRIG